jgi:hypothetical protein
MTHTEVTITCDRCGVAISASGATYDEAVTKLRALLCQERWRIVDRLDAIDPFTRSAPSLGAGGTPDLCGNCSA